MIISLSPDYLVILKNRERNSDFFLTDGYGAEIKGPELPSNLFECITVCGVPSEPKLLLWPEDGPAAPQFLVLVKEATATPMVGRSQHKLGRSPYNSYQGGFNQANKDNGYSIHIQ